MKQSTKVEAEILDTLKRAYNMRGDDLSSSIELSYQSLEKSKKLNNIFLIAKSLSNLSLYHMISADNEKAISMAEKAINYFTQNNDELEIAKVKYNIAGVYYKTNNHHLGMFYLVDCLTIFRKYEDKHNESRVHKSLGGIYEILGDQPNAIVAYENAIICAKETGDLDLESNVYNPLSGIFLKQDKIDQAYNLITKSISIKRTTGDKRGYAFAIYGRGKVLTRKGLFEEAENDFNEALKIHSDVSDKFGIAMCYNKMAHLYLKKGDRLEAKKHLLLAIKESDDNDLSLMQYKCYHLMYRIYKEEDNISEALIYLEKFIERKDNAVNSQTLRVIENYERISKIQSQENEAKLKRKQAEIIAKQERAEQAAAMKQNFLSAMSHEIRTPLNAVTTIISLLQERSDEGEKKLLTSLQFSAKNLLRIINDILDFSKLELNKMTLEEHPVTFRDLFNNIRDTYDGLASEKQIDLKLSIDPTIDTSYLIDETKLFQIMGNLVSNAIKFTEKGGVQIDVTMIQSQKDSDTIKFAVKDTGIGISSKHKTRLFESFYIPQSITTRHDEGTGLGLAIVKKLIELHGSTISLESVPGKGSNFFFQIDLKKPKTKEINTTQIAESLKNKVAILAEDNEINALVMNKLLSKWGVSVKRAKNGNDAISLAQENKVDFILMDIHMPKMNGFDATRTIRTNTNTNQTTPIFALTADITAANAHDYAHHFNGFLWKPIEIDKLFKTLSQVHEVSSITNNVK